MSATYTFSAATNNATASNQTKFESFTALHGKLRFKGDTITGVGPYNNVPLIGFPDRANLRFAFYKNGDTSNLEFIIQDTTNGILTLPVMSYTGFSSSAWYVLTFSAASGAGNAGAQIYDSGGTSLGSVTVTGNALTGTGAGNGSIRIGNDGTLARTWTIDGLALYSAALTGSNRTSVPTSGDSNIVALYKFDEGTGTSVADNTSGTALTINGSGTWNTNDGAWDGTATARFRPYFITG